MEKDTIVVVTNRYDPHADLIITKLNETSEKVVRFNTEDFPTQICFVFDSEEERMEFLLPYDRTIDVDRVKSIWYRRPIPHEIDPEVSEEPMRELARREAESVMRAFYECFDGFWISHPLKIRAASHKLYQLRLAKKLGFSIPPTLVTNSPDETKEFCHHHKERGIIVKPLSFPIVDTDEGHYSFATSRVEDEDIENLNQVKFTPTLFQAYVPKKHELRITVVGRQVFTCEIQSQISEETRLDWRWFDINNPIPHKQGSLPEGLERKIIELVARLELSFGALDFILTPDDEYVFLEINPNGQWAWIEEMTGMPISQAIINLLVKGGI